MQFLFLGIAAFLALMVIGRLLLSATPQTLARIVKIGAVILGAVIATFLAVTGRLGPAIALAMMLTPFIVRWRAMARRMKTAAGPTPGQRSAVRTAHLEAMLDHDSGEMDARVLDGPMAGRMLSDLEMSDLLELVTDFRRVDPQSAAIVEAYLDRIHGADWRRHDSGAGQEGGGYGSQGQTGSDSRYSHNGRSSSGGRMTLEEARAALGVDSSATREDIKSAHRHLMKRFHPDHGGTDYLAAKLNEAKEILLEYVED